MVDLVSRFRLIAFPPRESRTMSPSARVQARLAAGLHAVSALDTAESFAAHRVASATVPSGASVTHPSTGLVVPASAGVARRERMTGVEPIGVLVEGARSNLALYSEQLQHAVWGAEAFVTSDAAVAPDGALTADMITSGATVAESRIVQSIGGAAGVYTASVWVKADEAPVAKCSLRMGSGTDVVNFSATAEWVRHSFTSNVNTAIGLYNCHDGESGTPSQGESILWWGAQVEKAPFASSYIKTDGQSGARTYDQVSHALGTFRPEWSDGSAWQFLVEPTFSSAELLAYQNDVYLYAWGDGGYLALVEFAGSIRLQVAAGIYGVVDKLHTTGPLTFNAHDLLVVTVSPRLGTSSVRIQGGASYSGSGLPWLWRNYGSPVYVGSATGGKSGHAFSRISEPCGAGPDLLA